MCNSCWGCKFLYGDGSGYSNYTWMETYARCALSRNPELKGSCELPIERYDLDADLLMPEWEPIKDMRCDKYAEGEGMIVLDPDRECWPRDYSVSWEPLPFMDEEQYLAIWASACYGEPLPLEVYLRGHNE